MFERLVLVAKKTAYQELLDRYYSHGQASFFMQSRGQEIGEYEDSDRQFRQALARVRACLPLDIPRIEIDKEQLSTFLFRPTDLVIAVGPDGLVINIGKYLDGQPLVGVNPDPERIDGVLLQFNPENLSAHLKAILAENFESRQLTLGEARTNNGEVLLAANDFIIGRGDQASSRYQIEYEGRKERQSSSGVLVSTGVGASGWLKSLLTGAKGLLYTEEDNLEIPDWEDEELFFAVREPFPSRFTGTTIVSGVVDPDQPLTIISEMPEGGVIFSDGILDDCLSFNSGTVVEISVSERKINLVMEPV